MVCFAYACSLSWRLWWVSCLLCRVASGVACYSLTGGGCGCGVLPRVFGVAGMRAPPVCVCVDLGWSAAVVPWVALVAVCGSGEATHGRCSVPIGRRRLPPVAGYSGLAGGGCYWGRVWPRVVDVAGMRAPPACARIDVVRGSRVAPSDADQPTASVTSVWTRCPRPPAPLWIARTWPSVTLEGWSRSHV